MCDIIINSYVIIWWSYDDMITWWSLYDGMVLVIWQSQRASCEPWWTVQKLSPVIQTSASQLMMRMSPKTLRISGLKITILRKMAMNRNNGDCDDDEDGDCDDDEDGGGEVKQASLSGGWVWARRPIYWYGSTAGRFMLCRSPSSSPWWGVQRKLWWSVLMRNGTISITGVAT